MNPVWQPFRYSAVTRCPSFKGLAPVVVIDKAQTGFLYRPSFHNPVIKSSSSIVKFQQLAQVVGIDTASLPKRFVDGMIVRRTGLIQER